METVVNKKILGLLVIVIVVVAVAVAIWQMSPAPSAEARNIRMGIVAGMQTVEGQDIERAAKLAIDEINSAGGIWVEEWHTKVMIDFVLVDTVNDGAGNTAGPVKQAITDNQVDVLIGGATTGGTLNGQIPAIENRVPFIIVGASLNLVTRRGSLPVDNPLRINDTEGMSYMFHYCTTISDYSKTVTHFLAETVKPKIDAEEGFASGRKLRLAVIHRDDGYGRGVRDVTQSIITEDNLPIEVVGTAAYAASATTYQSQLISIKDSNPDAVFIAGFTPDTAEIVKEGINDVGLDSLYIAVEICEDPQFYSLLGETGSNQILESKVATQWQGHTWYLPKVGTYVENYKNKWNGIVPGMMGVDTYDSIYIYKDAVERAKTLNKTNVRDALETTDMEQSLLIMENGRITFSTGTNYHEITPKTFIEQLIWDSDYDELKPFVVYPDTMPGIGSFKQRDFVLPEEYKAGSP